MLRGFPAAFCIFPVVAISVCLAVACSAETGSVTEAQTLTEANAWATEHNSYIVVDFWHRLCGPCRAFAREIQTNAQLQEALSDLVLIKLDVEKPEGQQEADRHNVHQFPTYQLLNSKGEVIDAWIGYHNPQWWTDRLELALKDPVSQVERARRFQDNPTVDDALVLGKAAYASRRCRQANDYLRQAQQLNSAAAHAAETPIFLFRSAYAGILIGEYSVAEVCAIAAEVMQASSVNPHHIIEIADETLDAVSKVGAEPLLPTLSLVHSLMPAECEGEWEIKRQRFLLGYMLDIQKDVDQAFELKRSFMSTDWQDSSEDLNSFAWWCFENELNLGEAERLSRRSVEIALNDTDKANCLDTLSELVYLRGAKKEALNLINQAVILNPDSEYLVSQQERFTIEQN